MWLILETIQDAHHTNLARGSHTRSIDQCCRL